MKPHSHILLAAVCAAGLCLGFAACYRAPFVEGWYRCEADDQCGSGYVCDDGVCCNAEGTPICPTRAKGNGTCPDGGAPMVMYADRDLDGFGDPVTFANFCGAPSLQRYVLQSGDCVDTVGVGATAYPDAGELCDAIDNDCDGIEDDGLSGSLYYQDSDNDGAGDPNKSRSFCAPPDGGWVVSPNDCDPADGQRYPGATERCDGIDSNCNGANDDNPVDLYACTAGQGVCAAGMESCSGTGTKVCSPLTNASPERCNGLDDDCDGTLDEQPDCGGHANLLPVGVPKGAQRHSTFTSNPGYTTCQRGTTGWSATGASWAGSTWSGDAARTHLLWIEHPQAAAGGSWDLTKQGVKLNFAFDVSMLRQNTTVGAWSGFGQPIIMLCSKNSPTDTRIRWGNANQAMMGANSNHDELVPLDGSGTRWLKAQTGSLSDVNRIEIIVQPTDNGANIPHFDLQFSKLGFVAP